VLHHGAGVIAVDRAEAESRAAASRPFRRAQVTGHEDHGAGENPPGGYRPGSESLVEHAEEQVPQRIAGFFDFVEEHEADAQLVGVY